MYYHNKWSWHFKYILKICQLDWYVNIVLSISHSAWWFLTINNQRNYIRFLNISNYFLCALKTNLKCSNTLYNFFPFLYNLIRNLFHDNIGFISFRYSVNSMILIEKSVSFFINILISNVDMNFFYLLFEIMNSRTELVT